MINPTFNQNTTPSNNHVTTGAANPTTPNSRPATTPTTRSMAWTDEPAPTQPNNSKAILFGAIIVAGALFAIGFMTRGGAGGQPAQATAAAPVENYFTEQQKMMREAMDMAREAREAQREHMQLMRQQMAEGQDWPPNSETDTGSDH